MTSSTLKPLLPAIFFGLLYSSQAHSIDIFANINLEREVMVSRDAMNDFINNHRQSDPDFQYIRKIRYFSGNTIGIDVTSDFQDYSTEKQYSITNKILESWRVTKPKHVYSAAVKMYIQKDNLPFLYVSYTQISSPQDE